MANLSLDFSFSITPANGFRVRYRPAGSSDPYSVYPTRFFTSPAVISSLVDQDYEGFIDGDNGDGTFCDPVTFASSKYSCVGITDFNLTSTDGQITINSPITFAQRPIVNQTITVVCTDMVTNTVVGSDFIVVDQDGNLVDPIGIYTFGNLISNRNYQISLINKCNSAFHHEKQKTASDSATYAWITNTFTCEQDNVFTLLSTLTGFSSPVEIYFDAPTGRFYVGDNDNSSGNAYWFDPTVLAGPSDLHFIAGCIGTVYAVVSDPVHRRMYFVGLDIGGLKVLDIATNTFSTIPYGTEGFAFSRNFIKVLTDKIYLFDRNTGTITILDRATLAIINTKNITSIPSGTTYFDAFNMIQVGSELWITSEFRNTPTIAVYDLALTTLITTIALPGSINEFSSRYRQNDYRDEANDKVYIGDAGSSKLFVLDGASRTIVHTEVYTNRQGKLYSTHTFLDDPITGDLYMNVTCYSTSGDLTPKQRVFIMDRTTYAKLNALINQNFTSISSQSGTNKLFAVLPGTRNWEGGGVWMNDGQILKYSR